MTYKVYFDRRPAILSDNTREAGELPFYHFDFANVPKLLFRLENGEFPGLFFYHPKPEKAWNHFLQFFDVIRAAGGVVLNPEGRILFIHRRGIWDLPKGKAEPGETPENTALREVVEETGIEKPRIVRDLGNTYHVFWEGNRRKMKITRWFLMKSNDTRPLENPGREGIEKLEWLAPNNPVLQTATYASTKELLAGVRLPRAGAEN